MGSLHERRWYQEEGVESLFTYFAHKQGLVNEYGVPLPANPLVCMPTGTGKSHVIADFIKEAMRRFPGTRVIMETHVKELIEQNARKLQEGWPLAPLGIYSAGLKRRDTIQPIIFGGIQSSVGKYPLFGRRDLLVIDEAHLVSQHTDTSYINFIRELQWGEHDPTKIKSEADFKAILAKARNFNPYLKIIGLTATRYRLGLGCLTNGSIFTDVAYDLCTIEGFNRLIAEGYLSPLIPKRTNTELDVSNVGMSKGEFAQGELQAAVDKSEITYAALTEVVNEGYNRRSWLIFASGVEHAEHIGEMLNSAFGIPTCVIHSKKSDTENAKALIDWKRGKFRAAVNMNSLTTGVDHPAIDLIAMLRPTMSTGLWVQMLGRGTRPFNWFKLSPESQFEMLAFQGFIKENCLVLDFASNTRRLGPINDPVIPKKKGEGPPGDAPVRICPTDKIDVSGTRGCGTYNHASAKVCLVCGFVFPTQEKIGRHASNEELLRSDLPQIEVFDVQRVLVTPHVGKSSQKSSIKVSYFCSGAVPRTFWEYMSVETDSKFWRHISREWFRQRYTGYDKGWHEFSEDWDGDVPKTNALALQISELGYLRHPVKIRVWLNRAEPRIMGYEF